MADSAATATSAWRQRQLWTTSQLKTLQMLIQTRTPISEIAEILGRSEAAVKHAMRKVFLQSFAQNHRLDVADFYGIHPEALADFLVQDKYALPLSGTEAQRSGAGTGPCEIFTASLIIGAIFAGFGYFFAFIGAPPYAGAASYF